MDTLGVKCKMILPGFCLAATQRRNVRDTDLKIQGIVANRWMAIIQAFAGPPGNAPSPGYPQPVF